MNEQNGATLRMAATIERLERENADLRRQVAELRGAVDALMQPSPSELLAKNRAHPSRQ